MIDPKYFKRVKIVPSAAIKMVMHAQAGVEKGVKQSGKPVEIMGLLFGRIDTEDLNCIIISDAQPAPMPRPIVLEGGGLEERSEVEVAAVESDNDSTQQIDYMLSYQSNFELTRKERLCGWYHSHPNELDMYSHCNLSSADLTTQLSWQQSKDPYLPFIAIVIDPLRSLAKGVPEIMAFRAYPPDYSAPLNETPDGTFVTDEPTRVKQWGSCWNRFYKLNITYIMSSLARATLGTLKNQFLWQNALSSTPMLEQGKL